MGRSISLPRPSPGGPISPSDGSSSGMSSGGSGGSVESVANAKSFQTGQRPRIGRDGSTRARHRATEAGDGCLAWQRKNDGKGPGSNAPLLVARPIQANRGSIPIFAPCHNGQRPEMVAVSRFVAEICVVAAEDGQGAACGRAFRTPCPAGDWALEELLCPRASLPIMGVFRFGRTIRRRRQEVCDGARFEREGTPDH